MASAPFAPIEALDPKPAVPPARIHRREWMLGLLLLLLVGGFAGAKSRPRRRPRS